MFKVVKQQSSSLAVGIASSLLAALVGCGGEQHADRPAPATHQEALVGKSCDLNGTWAVRFTVPVTWGGNMGIRGGSGEVVQYARTVRKVQGNEVTDTLQVCGNSVPDYRASFLNERYGIRFPDKMFDSNVLPTVQVLTHLSGTTVGSTYESDPAVIQLGVAMKNPLTDAWPDLRGLANVQDDDQDGNPGITVVSATGAGYSAPPTGLNPRGPRAKAFFLALRNVAQISGTIDDCDKTGGRADVVEIAGVPTLNSHVLGGFKDNGSSIDDPGTLDAYSPKYIPNGPGTVSMVRVADDATCADVRNTDF